MRKLDLDKLAQPYVGRTDDYIQAIFPRATTAELADPTALVNRVGKHEGRMVYDTTLGQPVWAVDNDPASAWTGAPASEGAVFWLSAEDSADGATSFTTEAAPSGFSLLSGQRSFVDASIGKPTCTAEVDDAFAKSGTKSLRFARVGNFPTFNLPILRDSAFDSALLFSGDFTLQCWMRLDAIDLNSSAGFFGCYDDDAGDGAWRFSYFNITAGRFQFIWKDSLDNTEQVYFDGVKPSTGTWNHFAVENEGGTLRLYYNGVNQTPLLGTTTFNNFKSVTTPLEIGVGGANVASWNLDELLIVPKSLYKGVNFTPPVYG